MEYRLSLLEGTNVTKGISCDLKRAVDILSDPRGIVRVRAHGNYLAAELAEASYKIDRRQKDPATVNSARIDLHSLSVISENFHYLIENIAERVIMKRCVSEIIGRFTNVIYMSEHIEFRTRLDALKHL